MNAHLQASRAQNDFALDSTLTVKGNCWKKPDGHGSRFYQSVLSKSPKTVGEAITWAEALEQPFKAREVQRHLKWAFTGGCLEVNGQRYAEPKAEQSAKPVEEPKAEQPAEPKAKKTTKAKATKKVAEPKAKEAKAKKAA